MVNIPALLIIQFFLVMSLMGQAYACDDNDKSCLQTKIDQHVVRTLPYWEKYFSKPSRDRIYIAPAEVIDYIRLDNRMNGFPSITSAALPSEDFLIDIANAIDEVPDKVKRSIKNKFAGVFLVNNLGSTGFTGYIFDGRNNPVAGFVVLDAGVLQQRTANQWASWKESTPFKYNPAFKIEAIIASEKDDNRKYAIQYIFLHELGHILSINESIHPQWRQDPATLSSIKAYEFLTDSWRIDKPNNRFITRFDASVFTKRKRIVYYLDAKLDAGEMIAAYNQLERTDFVTLYAATNPYDDWAESFVTYVHSVLMKKPFQINIKRYGKVEKSYGLCWGTPRCAKKEAILERFFENN